MQLLIKDNKLISSNASTKSVNDIVNDLLLYCEDRVSSDSVEIKQYTRFIEVFVTGNEYFRSLKSITKKLSYCEWILNDKPLIDFEGKNVINITDKEHGEISIYLRSLGNMNGCVCGDPECKNSDKSLGILVILHNGKAVLYYNTEIDELYLPKDSSLGNNSSEHKTFYCEGSTVVN